MPVYRVRFALFTCCVAVAIVICPARVDAQGCSSCQAVQPAAVQFQSTTAFQGAGCNACAQTVAQPVQVQPLYQQPVYRPIPRTSYRTEWLPTRVTNYAPMTVLNPVTGLPVTTYRACQTQRYQIQRVPTFSLFSSPTNSCGSGCGVQPYTQSAVPGCSSCGVPSAYSSTTGIPYATTPAVAPAPAATSPGAAVAPGPATTQGGTEPAETRPSLKPQARTNAQGASIRDFYLQPSHDGRDDSPVPSLDPPSRSVRITPVPDPDVKSGNEQPRGDAPQLLDPRQKTAAASPTSLRTPYTRVAWPQTNTMPPRNQTIQSSKPVVADNASQWKTVDW